MDPSELLDDRLAAMRAHLADVLCDHGAPLGMEWEGWDQSAWSSSMPTVGAAFGVLEREGAELVAAMVADVEAAAEAFDLAAEVATLAALWPWPRMFAPEGSSAPSNWHPRAALAAGALGLLQLQARTKGEAPPPPMTMGRICELVPSMGRRMSNDADEIDALGFSWTEPALGMRVVSGHALACARHPGEVIARWADDWRHRRDPAAEHLLTAAAELRAEGANEDKARRHLAGELADELRGLGERMTAPGADPVELARAALAAIGATGADLAERIERWRLVAAWHPTVGLCARLAAALWADRVKPKESAKPVRLLRHAGDQWATVPKLAQGVAWSLGAPGVELDGDAYATAPGLTWYVSRSFGLYANDGKGAWQQSFPLGARDDLVSLPVRVVGDTQAVLSPLAGKVALWCMATARPGGLRKATLRELSEWLRPTVKRIQARDDRYTAAALRELRGLMVRFPDHTEAQLFDLRAPVDEESASAEQEVWWGWSGSAAEVIAQGALPGGSGDFLLNLTGAMRLDTRHPLDLRLYVFGAGLVNEKWRRADLMPVLPLGELAARVNALSDQAAAYRADRERGRRQDASAAEAATLAAVERVKDAGLLKAEIRGRQGRRTVKLLPTEGLLEAHAKKRKGKP